MTSSGDMRTPTAQGNRTAPPSSDQPNTSRALPTVGDAQMLQMIADRTNTAIVVTDATGLIQWVNAAFVTRSGMELDQVRGMPGHILTGGSVPPEYARMRELFLTGQQFSIDVPALTGGAGRWTQVDGEPVYDQGRLEYYIVFHRDATERVERERDIEAASRALSEERNLLTEIINALPSKVWWKDAGLRYEGYNEAIAASYSRIGTHTAVGSMASEISDQAFQREFEDAERRVLASDQPIIGEHIRLERSGEAGRASWLLRSIVPRHDKSGNAIGVIGIADDVTRIVQMEQKLLQTSRLESIGQLAAGVAHEINTPIQYVSDNTTFVQEAVSELLDLVDVLLAHSELDEVAQAAVAAADLDYHRREVPAALHQSAEGLTRVGDIVKAMKDFSHPGGDFVHTDLNRAIASTVTVSRNEWKYTAELHLDLDDSLPAVPCREGEIKQMILNLIVNAAHAIVDLDDHGAKGSITISTTTVDAGTDRASAEIRVIDTGCGMPEDVQSRIFDPFFTTKAVGRGTGQGLSLAHQTVEAHQGSIEVSSRPGVGTTFVVRLPLGSPSAESVAGAPEALD